MECDALFFLQLLLPIADPAMSGISEDPRMPYYSNVERWSRKYASSIGCGGSYGHAFAEPFIEDFVRFDSVVVRDGVHGGSSGAIYLRWDKRSTCFDQDIADSMTHTRWLQLKRIFKLCDNDTAPRRGQEGYNPAYKYDYIFRYIIENLNAITKYADLDLCGDETTFPTQAFGEAGCNLVARRVGKPGVTKGGQIVLLCDVHHNRPRAYIHRHNLNERFEKWPEGPSEVRQLIENHIAHLVVGNDPKESKQQIFAEKPHSTWDNYFSGDQILNWLGSQGYGATMTFRRDRLPKDVPDKYFHKVGTAPGDKKARVARFFPPVTACKNFPKNPEDGKGEAFTRVHCSFQSTSSCNIGTVNAVNQNALFGIKKERGRGKFKRKWVIEMNQPRQLYLATYGRVDTLDSAIAKCQLYYRSWKYWHPAKCHGHAMAVAVAYDIYVELLTEPKAREFFSIDPQENGTSFRKSFQEFRDILSSQGMLYSPTNLQYPGDSKMRVNTRKRKAARKEEAEIRGTNKKRGRPKKGTEKESLNVVTPTQYMEATKNKTHSRGCGDLLTKYIRD